MPFNVNKVGGKLIINREERVEPDQHQTKGTIQRNNSSIKFVPETYDDNFDNFFSIFTNDVAEMRLTQKQNDSMYTLCEKLIDEYSNLCVRAFEKEDVSTTEVMNIQRQKNMHLKKPVA